MLEKVSVQRQSVSSIYNPISSALSWKIPVYSFDYVSIVDASFILIYIIITASFPLQFQVLLSKKLSQIQLTDDSGEKKNDKSVRVFHKRYLKLEHVVAYKYRPEFREVSKWPAIDTNSPAGSCPFDTKSSRKSAQKDGNKKKDSDRYGSYLLTPFLRYSFILSKFASITTIVLLDCQNEPYL